MRLRALGMRPAEHPRCWHAKLCVKGVMHERQPPPTAAGVHPSAAPSTGQALPKVPYMPVGCSLFLLLPHSTSSPVVTEAPSH
jgi:hypothetical protein